MKTTQLTEFECCYISDGQLNAHRYKLEVTVSGLNRYAEDGMILEFEKFKDYLNQVVPSGKFLYSSRDSSEIGDVALAMTKCGVPVQMLNLRISCETLCEQIALDLQNLFYKSEPGVGVRLVRLRETPESFAVWGSN